MIFVYVKIVIVQKNEEKLIIFGDINRTTNVIIAKGQRNSPRVFSPFAIKD